MRIIRYRDPAGQIGYAAEQPDGAVLQIAGDIFGEFRLTGKPAVVQQLLAPVAPPLILAIGLNYRGHAVETRASMPEFPVVFLKAITALQHPGAPILLPRHLRSDAVDYEAELAVVIGRTCRNVTRAAALDYVLGYTCANDVSARDWQKNRSGGQWCRAKSFDTFCPVGPALVTRDQIPEPHNLRLQTIINGEVLQDANTADMIFPIPQLIEFLSGSTTLLAGTLILTGTPQGVGMARTPPRWLQPGDRVTVAIERIGELTNPVAEEPLGTPADT